MTDPAATRPALFERSNRAESPFTSTDWVLFVAIASIWGSSFLFIAIGLESLEPGLITLLRVGLGAAALTLLNRSPIEIQPADRTRVLLLSVIWVGIPFTLFPLAEQHINSAVTGLLNGATPIFTGLVAALLLGQIPRGLQRLGLFVGFLGVVLISLPSLWEGSTQALGVGMVLAATISYGFAINLAGPLQQRYGSVVVMTRMTQLGIIWTLPYGLWGLRDSRFEWGPVAAVAALGLIGTGVAFLIMATLVGRVGSTRAASMTYLIPAIALALGVVFQGDDVAPIAVVGVATVIVGAALASRQSRLT